MTDIFREESLMESNDPSPGGKIPERHTSLNISENDSESEEKDDDELMNNKSKMFSVDDRVRIAHRQEIIEAFGTGCDLTCHKCPLKKSKYNVIGAFGFIFEIRENKYACANKLNHLMEMSEETILVIQFSDPNLRDSLGLQGFPSIDVINYRLLGNEAGDQLFQDSCDEDFNWTLICTNADFLLNAQMKSNMNATTDLRNNTKIENAVCLFQKQAHLFCHHFYDLYFRMNRKLRKDAHIATLICKNKENLTMLE
jgi:hypothetical protein